MSEIDYILAENQHLKTDRLLLRPVTLVDAEAMFAYASDNRTIQFLTFPAHENLQTTKVNIATYFMKAPLGKYGIELKMSGKMIGTIDLRLQDTSLVAEIGYVIHSDYWGNGYVTEAAQELLRLGFEDLKLEKVEGEFEPNNLASGRVLEKLGMTKEGCIRKAVYLNGRWRDYVVYGILKEEYFNQRTMSNEV